MAVAGAVVAVPVRRDAERDAVTALDAATGRARWIRRASVLCVVAAVGDSTFVVWSDRYGKRGSVAGVDALTGETLWEHECEGIEGLLVRGELVILGDGRFRALHGRSGDEIWSGGDGEPVGRAGAVEDAAVFLSWRGEPYGPKSLVVGASDTGEQLAATRFPTEAQGYIGGHPELVDGGRALFHRPAGRRVRLLGYAGRRGRPTG
ncbi:PQQ-binding-like beta-propeller repeat protein [Streptomyces sp. cg40]|uniref:outer membrane protein assembly factor BamB family protein n=1 Tax=Streptomyces sp. cg40 TaxID=3419764 RepID=UPI003D02B59F